MKDGLTFFPFMDFLSQEKCTDSRVHYDLRSSTFIQHDPRARIENLVRI